jgi:hypothetical protein
MTAGSKRPVGGCAHCGRRFRLRTNRSHLTDAAPSKAL